MASNPKNNTQTPDELIYEDLDGVNRQQYYKAVEKELLQTIKETEEGESIPQHVIEEQKNKYVQSYRSFYYTNGILAHNKSNEFFDEALREIHPTVKLKGPAKGLLKVVCKVFMQELAEACFEVGSHTNRPEVDCEVVNDAYRLMEKRRVKKGNAGQLFDQIHY